MTKPAELSIHEAVARLRAALPAVGERGIVVLREAAGRVLASDIVAPFDIPAFDNSAMDGYALRADDTATGRLLRAVGRALAGHAYGGHVDAGTCVRIMTGAPLPDGADAVAMIEHVREEDGGIQVEGPIARGANVRRRGEHVAAGDVVLRAGRWLTPACIGMATLVGAADVAAFRRLRVGVLSTGDELADPPAALAAAGSYDANRPTLVAAARRLGFDTSDLGICADEPTAFSRILGAALDLRLDALIVSGGAAQGDADIVRQAGGIEFLPLNFRPGRGIAFAHLRRGDAALALLGLPGNAVAAFIMFHLVARPVLLHLAGADADVPRHLPLPLAVDVEVRGGRIEYRRARFVGGADGRLAVVPLKEQGSAMLRTVTDADALIALGPQPRYRAGEPVGTIPLALLE